MHFAVGFKVENRRDHVIVDAEDALAAALEVKKARPDAMIIYVRHTNKRGDARHPGHALAGASAASRRTP